MQDAMREHDGEGWAERPWLLAGLLGAAGLLIHLVGGGEGIDTAIGWRAAVTAFLFFGGLAFAFTLERTTWKAPLLFAVIVGAVMAGLAWRAVSAGERVAGEEFGFLAGVIATGLALPLYQAGFHRTRWATSYRSIHGHVWSDAIAAAGSLAFVGASWLMLLLLSELFMLLRISLLSDLIDQGWFGWTWSGAAFGAALGVLRNEGAIIGTLRRVVMTVLSLLAVPLAAGLALFLAAMLVSGPEVLWAATRSATPVLLTCAAGAWVLANAILRDEDGAMSANRVLRAAGLVLVLSVFPLTLFAAISMGTRVAQHGLSPERLWGLVAIAVAVAYGVAWLVAVVRGRKGGAWRERARRANLHLAVMISAVALFLALPILDFGAISARQQLARLERGAVSVADFDYTALRWDFGAAGRAALRKIEASGTPEAARLAGEARRQTVRPYPSGPVRSYTLRLQPENAALEPLVRRYLRSNPWACDSYCVALDLGPAPGGRRRVGIVSGSTLTQTSLSPDPAAPEPAFPARDVPQLRPDSRVEIRSIARRYVVVDGKPFEQPIDELPSSSPPPAPLAPPPPRR